VRRFSKAKRVLGWQPEVSFHELVEMMVDADMNRVQKEIAVRALVTGITGFVGQYLAEHLVAIAATR
jgi:GDP-D-mannose dehydratase